MRRSIGGDLASEPIFRRSGTLTPLWGTFKMVHRTHPVTELSTDSRWTWKTWIPQASFNPLQRHTQTSSEQPTKVLKDANHCRQATHLKAFDALRSRVAHRSDASLLETDIFIKPTRNEMR